MFIKDILNLLKEYTDWYYDDSKKAVRPKNMMDKLEWLIDEYKLEDWYSTTYKGNELSRKCYPTLKVSYRRIFRA